MPKWYMKIDGVKMGIEAPTREEAMQLGVDGLANRDILNNVKANSLSLGNPETNPDYAPTVLNAVRGAIKYEQETRDTSAWLPTGFRNRKDFQDRLAEHDTILKQRQFTTITDVMNKELEADEKAWKASIRKKNPDAVFTRNAQGQLTASDRLSVGQQTMGKQVDNPNAKVMKPKANANTVNSASTELRKKELAQYSQLDVSDTKFSPNAMNIIRSFVEERMIVGPLPSYVALRMASELKAKHPDWNGNELSKAVKYYIGHMSKNRASANPYGEGKKLAEEYNKKELEFDSGRIPGRNTEAKQALKSGVAGTALGVARGFTFGAGEDRASLWLKKQGWEPDKNSALIGQIATIALPGKVVGGAVGAVGKALSSTKMASALRNMATLGEVTVDAVRGQETMAGIVNIARSAGLLNKVAAGAVKAYRGTKALSGLADEAIASLKSAPAGSGLKKGLGHVFGVAKGLYDNGAIAGQITQSGNNLVREILRGYNTNAENITPWTDIVGSLAQGFEQGDLGKMVEIAANDKDPEIRKLASQEAQQHMDAITSIYVDPEFQNIINSPDLKNKLMHPKAIVMMAMNSLGIMQRALNTQVASAAWGSGLGALPARALSGLASGKGSFDIEYGTTFMEEALKAGFNPMEPESMEKLLQNKGVYQNIKGMAERRGVAVGAFDMLAAFFGGVAEAKLGRALRLSSMANVAKPNMFKVFLTKALDFTGEQVLGGLGEAAGQIAKDPKAKINISEVQNEMLGDVKGLVNIAVGQYADSNDAEYAWATTVKGLSTEQQIEQYKVASKGVAMRPESSEMLAMKKGLKKALTQKIKDGDTSITEASINEIETEADNNYRLDKQSTESKQALLLHIDTMSKVGDAPVTPEVISYRNRIINSMSDTELEQLGITATGEVETDSPYEQKLNAVIRQHEQMTTREASDELYAEMVASINDDVEIPANVPLDALIARGQEITSLRDASDDENPQLAAEYDKQLDAINVALIMQGHSRVFNTTNSDVVSGHEVSRYVASEMDGQPEGFAKFTIDGKQVTGVVHATDGGVYFKSDDDGEITPIHQEDLNELVIEPQPVEEAVAPIEPVAEATVQEQVQEPVAEEAVAEPAIPAKNENGIDTSPSTDGVVRNGSVHMVPISVLRDSKNVDIVRTYTTTIRTQNQMKALALDIKRNGLKNPVELAIEPDGKITIIEGTHRIYAYAQLRDDFALDGYDNIPVTFVNESVSNGSAQKFIDSLHAQNPIPAPTKPVEQAVEAEPVIAQAVEPEAQVEEVITEQDIADIMKSISDADTGFSKHQKKLANTPEGLTKAGKELSDNAQDARDEAEQELDGIISEINSTLGEYGLDIEIELDTDYGDVDVYDGSGVMFENLTTFKQIKDSIKSLLDGIISSKPKKNAPVNEVVEQVDVNAEQAREAMKKEDAKQVRPEDMHPDDIDMLVEQYGGSIEPNTWTVPDVSKAGDDRSSMQNAKVVQMYEKMGRDLDAGHAEYLDNVRKLMSGELSDAQKEKVAKKVAEYRSKQVTYENAKRAANAAMHVTVLNAIEATGMEPTRNGLLDIEPANKLAQELNDTHGGSKFTVESTGMLQYAVHYDGKPIPNVMFATGTKSTAYEGADTLYMEFNKGVEDLLHINQAELMRKLSAQPVPNPTGAPAMTAKDIIRTFSKAAGLFTYVDDNMNSTGYLGMAHLMNRTIALRDDKDLDTWLHEFGHELIKSGLLTNMVDEFNQLMNHPNYAQFAETDGSTGLNPGAYGSMLKFIVAASGQYADVKMPNPANISEQEGIAEMFRMYTLDPEAMQVKLPRAYAIFNDLLPATLKQVSSDIKTQIYILHSLTPVQQSQLANRTEDSVFANLTRLLQGAEDVWGSGYKTNAIDWLTFQTIDRWYPSMNKLREMLITAKKKSSEDADKIIEEYNVKISQLLGARGAAQATMMDATGKFGLLTGPGSKQKISLADVTRALQNGSQDEGVFATNKEAFKTWGLAATHIEDAVHKLQALEDVINEVAEAWCNQKNVPFTPYTLSDRNTDVLEDTSARDLILEIDKLSETEVGGTLLIIQKALDAQGINQGFKIDDKSVTPKSQSVMKKQLDDLKRWVRRGGGSVNSATQNYSKLDEYVGQPAMLSVLKDASAKYNALSQAMLYKQHTDGLIDLGTYLRITNARTYYMDTHRVDDAIEDTVSSPFETMDRTATGRNASDTQKSREGSMKDYDDPIQGLSKQIEATFVQGADNQVKSFWSEFFLNDSENGPDAPMGYDPNPIKLQKGVPNPSGALAHEVIGPVSPEDMKNHRVIVYRKDGQKRYVQINNELVYKSLQNVSDIKSVALYGHIIAMQRKMITMSPSFIIRNMFRDRFGVWRKSKHISQLALSKDWWQLVLGLTKDGKVIHEDQYNELKAAGVAQATFAIKEAMSFEKLQKQMAKQVIAEGLTGASRVWFLFKNDMGFQQNSAKKTTLFKKVVSAVTTKPVTNYYGFVERMAERSEMSPRVLEYQKAYEKYVQQEQAWIDAEIKRRGIDMQLATSGANTPEAVAEKRKLDIINDRGHYRSRAYAAHDARALQDFGRVGNAMPLLNTLFGPFLSGRVAGVRADWNATFKRNKDGRTVIAPRAAKAMLALMLLSSLDAWMWYSDEDRRRKYLGFTDAVKDTFLLIPGLKDFVGEGGMIDEQGVFAIPYGFQDAVFASIGRRFVDVMYTADKDDTPSNEKRDRALQLMQEWVIRSATADFPITPSSLSGPTGLIVGLTTNMDSYTQRNIVPIFETTKMVSRREGIFNASMLALTLTNFGKLGKIDPRQLDYTGQKLFGTTARDIQAASNLFKPANTSMLAFEKRLNTLMDTLNAGEAISPEAFLAMAGERMKETPLSLAGKVSGVFSKEQTFFDDVVTRDIDEARYLADISTGETKRIFAALAVAANTDDIKTRAYYINVARAGSGALVAKYRAKPFIPKLRR